MNEPAFPFKCQWPTTGPEIYYGMSLRDYFAAKALANPMTMQREPRPDLLAQLCFEISDAMVKQRDKE